MKRLWNIKKKSGVSPVIATILMVAITVVLAAVLYVMVMNMSGNQGTSTPQGSFASSTTQGNYVNITFGSFSTNTGISAVKMVVQDINAGSSGTYNASSNADGSLLYLNSGTTTITSITYKDVANNGHINVGDYVSILNPSAGTGHNWKITMIFIASGDVINYLEFSY
jgi:flagellin-like protein